MKTAFVFFADGFEEIEAFTTVDVLRRAGINALMVSVTEDEIVRGAHDISMLCDKTIDNVDFSEADMLLLPGGMPGASNLAACELLTKQLKVQENTDRQLMKSSTLPHLGQGLDITLRTQQNLVEYLRY